MSSPTSANKRRSAVNKVTSSSLNLVGGVMSLINPSLGALLTFFGNAGALKDAITEGAHPRKIHLPRRSTACSSRFKS